MYGFPIAQPGKDWARKGLSPFPPNTALRFLEESAAGEKVTIDLPWQGVRGPTPEDVPPILGQVSGSGRSMQLQVRFPADIDLQRLPERLMVEADAPPPAERRQIQHLRRWTDHDNARHDVLGAIVHPVAPGQPVRPIELHSASLRGNRAQMKAIRLCLSEAPLVLIKGPPGTGKTTVIVEAVRQEVRLGRRVLVCSQSHQAVRNVLERLHEIGGYRMARYGRDDNLQGVEREYRESAFGAASFPKQVVDRSRATLESLRQRIAYLDRGADLLRAAELSAESLAAARLEAQGEEAQLDATRQHDQNLADTVLGEGRARAEAVEAANLRDPPRPAEQAPAGAGEDPEGAATARRWSRPRGRRVPTPQAA